MTITLAWLRRTPGHVELVVASDSRLRSHGAMDQAQKLFALDRGDCCLAFCGDAQLAYPLFIQVNTALNSFLKTRSRAEDTGTIRHLIATILDNLVASWNIPLDDKVAELLDTRILFAGWSWIAKRFDIGYYVFTAQGFVFHHQTSKPIFPWLERKRSLVFIGDYENDFRVELSRILERRLGPPPAAHQTVRFDFDFEPVQALHSLLSTPHVNRPLIGGAPQLVKIYQFANSLPFVIRTAQDKHYLLGRRLFSWEKTQYPILDLRTNTATVLYPQRAIPLPASVVEIADEPPTDEALNTSPSIEDQAND